MPTPKLTVESAAGCANPELGGWLWEWYRDARDRDARIQFAYRRALTSLIACKERLKSGRDALRLPGIGEAISEKLEKKLQQHIAAGNPWHCAFYNDHQSQKRSTQLPSYKRKERRANPNYVPPFRSSTYAVLLGLHERGCELTKEGILLAARPHCNTVLDDHVVHTALRALLDKSLVVRMGLAGKYELSDDGCELACRLWSNAGHPPIDRVVDNRAQDEELYKDPEEERDANGEYLESDFWPVDSFSIKVLIDLREVRNQNDRDGFINGLDSTGIPVEQRSLSLGDILFVAVNDRHDEAVLDIVIERKTDSDLVASIPDGRFKEQKHRLRKCCIRNVIYLVEGCGVEDPSVSRFGPDKYSAALINTLISDAFYVMRCRSLEETMVFIADCYRQLTLRHKDGLNVINAGQSVAFDSIREELSNNPELLMPYSLYSALNSKSGNLTAFEVFVQQLMCIRGLSVEKAVLIAQRFPSYPELLTHYSQLPDETAKKRAFAEWQLAGRKFGPVLSEKIHQFLFAEDYNENQCCKM